MARNNQIGSGGNTGMQMAFETSIRVPLDDILPNPYQPPARINPPAEGVKMVADSIEQHGLLQTPVVRQRADGKYEMGDGWVRLCAYKLLVDRAGQQVGVKSVENYDRWKLIPVIIRNLTDMQMADMIMEANRVRLDLTPIDLATFYKKYLEDFKCTQTKLAELHNISQGEIANTMRLLELPEGVQQMIISQEISATHGRTLLPLKEAELICRYAQDAKTQQWTVATLEANVKSYIEMQKPVVVKTCRVCGCTDAQACQTPEGPCHWTEDDLCSACQKSEETGKANFAAAFPGLEDSLSNSEVSEETAGSRVGARDDKNNKKPEPPKKAPPAPAKSVTSTKPNTPGTLPSRKLILTEMADGVMAAVTTAKNPFPFMKKLPGTIEDLLAPPGNMFLDEAAIWWNKDSKEGK